MNILSALLTQLSQRLICELIAYGGIRRQSLVRLSSVHQHFKTTSLKPYIYSIYM